MMGKMLGQNASQEILRPAETPASGKIDLPKGPWRTEQRMPDISGELKAKLERLDASDTSLPEESLVRVKNVDARHCPVENGEWVGERGQGKWVPDGEYVPGKANPDNQTWDEIMEEYAIDGVEFKEGEPDFAPVSKGDVEIDEFSTSRSDNFDKADIALAEQRGCQPEDVERWRKENHYTWHEKGDMKTLQKVPSKLHNNITHSGGIAAAKNNGDVA